MTQTTFLTEPKYQYAIDMGYLVYQWVLNTDTFYSSFGGCYAAELGYLMINEGTYSGYNIRKEYHPEYKANRSDYKYQDIHIKAKAFWLELLNNSLYATISRDGYEADDLCALVALKNGLTIISGDKDYLQLPVSVEKLDHQANTINYSKLPKTIQGIEFSGYDWLLWLVLDGDVADNIPRLRAKGKRGLEEFRMLLEYPTHKDTWEMAYKIYGEELLHNLMLIILPHPSLARATVGLKSKDVLDLVINGEYYTFMTKYGVDIL